VGRRESPLEARCVKWARWKGAVVAKLTGCAGVPDRIFFLPGGAALIVEFKAEDEAPEELQSWYLKTLRKHGFTVAHCDTWEGFQEIWKRASK
jgi:hypothetical protein